MGANTLLNASSVEEECGGAFFSEVVSFWLERFFHLEKNLFYWCDVQQGTFTLVRNLLFWAEVAFVVILLQSLAQKLIQLLVKLK